MGNNSTTSLTVTDKKRALRYLNRDFESFKKDLIEHIKIYFPDTFQDFNESSVGIMLMELMAFIGDNLSFYLDKRFNETFLETAKETKNVFKHAKQLGFKPFGKASATGLVDGFLKVPARRINQRIIPDIRFAGIIKKGAKLKSGTGQTYESLIDADFSTISVTNPNLVAVADRDSSTDEPTTFILKKEEIEVKAGETKTTTFTVGAYEAFKKLKLTDDDVLEILEVIDSEANEWFEVDFLAQDTVFDGVANAGDDSDLVPNVLKLRSVPFRFISEFDPGTGKTSLIFGTGDAQNFDGDLIPNLGDISLPLFGRDTFTDFALDPQNFLKTKTLGLAPVNTTITVKYRVGGGLITNAGANEITTVAESTLDVADSTLDAATIQDVANSFSVLNPTPIQGGKDVLDIDVIKQLIPAHFATQGRTVTDQDFVVRSLSMPSKFGSVFRANAQINPLNGLAIELVILAQDLEGKVSVASGDLKENLKRFLDRFRMFTDAIELLDGEIINFAINFSVLTNPDFNKSEVLANCIEALKEMFEIDKWQINQPINKTSIITLLASIPGVLSVRFVRFLPRVGTFEGRSYSTKNYDFRANSLNGIIYGESNSIFEIKFVNKDIFGNAL